jgi:hypothetical protein
MNLFSRWRKSDGKVRIRQNNKSILIGNRRGLFDDIVDFEDVKSLFGMAIKAERLYIYYYVDHHHLENHCS